MAWFKLYAKAGKVVVSTSNCLHVWMHFMKLNDFFKIEGEEPLPSLDPIPAIT